MLSKLDMAISRSLKSEDVLMFWSKYKEVFSPQKEKLWDGLLFGLNKYLPVLQGMENNLYRAYVYKCFNLF